MSLRVPARVASRVRSIQPSITLAVDAKAKQLKAEGRDIIGFGAGEPDFDTPDHIKNAAIAALNKGVTKYAPSGGSLELRDAIVHKLKRDNGLTYKRSQVIVNIGAKHTLYEIFMAIVERGNEVIIPAPYWVSYPEMVRACEGVPVFVSAPASQNFKITPRQLEKAITAHTVAVVLNSPSNPTGMVYTPEELHELAEVAVAHGQLIISDEIYEKLLYEDAKFVSVASFSPEIYERTVTVNGFSKAFSMTGWRLGYAAGPEWLIEAMNTLQSHSTSNPVSFAMSGAVEALNAGYDFLPAFLEAFDRRRRALVKALNAIEGVTCPNPKGAFYVFPDFSALLGLSTPEGKQINNTLDLSEYLLEQGVAVVPGEGFGAPGCLRLSYAISDKNVEEGARRIAAAIERLQ